MNTGHNTEYLDVARYVSRLDDIAPVSNRVKEITDWGIGQTRETLIKNLADFRRKSLDPSVRKIFGETYPVGQCEFIRDQVYRILQRCSRPVYHKYPDFSPSRIPLRKIWSIKHDSCMNNGIQYGNWIIDAANDTTYRDKYPVTVLKIDESGMRNPRDHEDLCTVFEQCWPIRCYPNVYYPDLAPFFPVICVFDEKIGFVERSFLSMDAQGIFDGCKSAYRFLYQSSFSTKKLSDEQLQQLIDKNNPSLPSIFHARSGVKRHDIEKQFSRVRGQGPGVLARRHIESYGALKKAGILLAGGI